MTSDLVQQLADLVGDSSAEGLKRSAVTILADAEGWHELNWDRLWEQYEGVQQMLIEHADARKDVVYDEDFDFWLKYQRRLMFMEAYLWQKILSQMEKT